MTNGTRWKGIYLLLIPAFFSVTAANAYSRTDDEVISEVREYVEQTVKNLHIPGAAFALVKEGSIVHTSAYGITPAGMDVKTDTPFLIGSISKTLTAYGILKLTGQHQINLEDKVQKYLPSLSIPPGSNGRELKIRHLLTHRSGISTWQGLRYADLGLDHPDAISQTLTELFSDNIELKPGADFAYSAANYLILAGVIESVTGERFSEYMQQNIFQPLGMADAAANREEAVRRGWVNGYQSWFGFNIPSRASYDNAGAPYGYIAASATDMAYFLAELQSLYSAPPASAVSRLMQKPSAPDNSSGYGFGVRFLQNGEVSLAGHGGSNADFRSEM